MDGKQIALLSAGVFGLVFLAPLPDFSGLHSTLNSVGAVAPLMPRAQYASPSLRRSLVGSESDELIRGMIFLVHDQYAQALPILGKYAMMGDVRAQSGMGAMDYAGLGIVPDREEGIRWFQIAASHGGQVEREALAAAMNGTWHWDEPVSQLTSDTDWQSPPLAYISPPPTTLSNPSSMPSTPSIEQSELYQGGSGAHYRYDLSNPSDQMRYSLDVSAQLNDSISVDPRRDIDRSMYQNGGGIQR